MRVGINIVVLIFWCTSMWAQSTTDTLPGDQVEVLKRFAANLETTEKVKFSPKPTLPDTTPRHYVYDFSIVPAEVPKEKAQFVYDELQMNEVYVPYHGIVKLGFGWPNQPYGLVSFGMNTPGQYHWNAFVQHHSLGESDAFQDISRTNGGFSGGVSIHNDWAVKGGFQVARNRFQYYPLRQDSLFEESDVDRSFLELNPHIGIEGYLGLWQIQANANYQFLKDNEGPKQNLLKFNGSVQKTWDDDNHFIIQLDAQTGKHQLDTSEAELNKVELGARWSKLWSRWSSTIGIKLIGSEEFVVLPDITLGFILHKDLAHLKLRAFGEAAPLSYQEVILENPFINSSSSLDLFQKHIGGDIALEGKASVLSYQGGVRYKKFQSRSLFINDSLQNHLFNIISDDIDEWSIFGHVNFEIDDHFEVGLNMEKFFYTTKNQEKPYHLPGYNLHIFAQAGFLNNQLQITPSFRMLGGAAFIENNASKNLDPIIDLSLSMGYKFNTQWSLFLEAGNLLNQPNSRYYLYDQIGINFLTGIMYKF